MISIHRRNTNHWDIYVNKARAFRMRGLDEFDENCIVCCENEFSELATDWVAFPDKSAAIVWIMSHLLRE